MLEAARVLAKDDPELAELLRLRLVSEGIDIRDGAAITRIERVAEGLAVVIAGPEGDLRLVGSHLLVAAGRVPNVASLDLEAAGIAHDRHGVRVDTRLRTTNPRVFAIGDVAGGPQFTHVAGYHAGIVIRNALFRIPAKVDYRAVPWVTYTDPELAHVGLTEAAARERHGNDITILRSSFHENDRAQAERVAAGLVKIVARKSGRILGASILGAHAGGLHPAVDPRGRPEPQDQRLCRHDRAIPDAGRGRQAGGGELFHPEAVQRAHPPDRPLPHPVRLSRARPAPRAFG